MGQSAAVKTHRDLLLLNGQQVVGGGQGRYLGQNQKKKKNSSIDG
jgi:hypothetical protein